MMRKFTSRHFIAGGFAGAMLMLAFLAACGGGGGSAIAQAVLTAMGIEYDNSASGLTADNVQAAIDETEGRVDTLETTSTDHGSRLDTLETASADHDSRVGVLEADSSDHASRIGTLETDSSDHEDRLTVLEGSQTAADISYDNSTSGLSSSTVKGAVDELAAASAGGQVFIRWGNTNAPSGTTKLYDGTGVQSTGSESVFVMKAGDAGGSNTTGGLPRFMATNSSSSAMPPGITANRRIVGCVCYSPKPVAIIYGTQTAPSGWSVLYKGYVMTNSHAVIVIDADNFDSSATSVTGADLDFTSLRFSQTFDSTNYPTGKHIKAAVIAKN